MGAHTDDIELGCGAFLSRLQREGSDIRVATFSRAEASLPPGLPPETLELEYRASMSHLGLTGDAVYTGSIPVRHFPEYRQAVLETLVTMNREFDPDLVLTMNSQDTHQDHEVVHKESVRAFRGKTLLGYEIPWNQHQNAIDLFVEVSDVDVHRKAAMLQEYRSQLMLSRTYMEAGYVKSAAVFRGYQGRLALAEAYELLAMTWKLS